MDLTSLIQIPLAAVQRMLKDQGGSTDLGAPVWKRGTDACAGLLGGSWDLVSPVKPT